MSLRTTLVCDRCGEVSLASKSLREEWVRFLAWPPLFPTPMDLCPKCAKALTEALKAWRDEDPCPGP